MIEQFRSFMFTCSSDCEIVGDVWCKFSAADIAVMLQGHNRAWTSRRPYFDSCVVTSRCNVCRVGCADIDTPCTTFVLIEKTDTLPNIDIPQADDTLVIRAC